MTATKFLLWTALGVGAVMLLTSDRAKAMRDDLEDKTMDNFQKWKGKILRTGSDTTEALAELRDVLESERDGLSKDVRQRLENILDGATKSAGKIKKSVNHQLA